MMEMDLERELKELRIDESRSEKTLDTALVEGRRRFDRKLRRIARPRASLGGIETPVGRLLIAQSDRGIVAIRFLGDNSDLERQVQILRAKFDLVENPAAAREVAAEITGYVQGDLKALKHGIDLTLVTGEFQRRVLRELVRIPGGSVITYQGLAQAIGASDAQRAVGNTMASNPVPFYVPCHRVIRSDATLGHYGGGVDLKATLLRTEGFEVAAGPKLSRRVVLGHRATRIFCRPGCPAAMRAARGKMLIFADATHAQATGMRPCRLCRPF